MTEKLTRTDLKGQARELLMDGIADILGYWSEKLESTGGLEKIPPAQRREFDDVLWREADRVAKLLGYERAWNN